jgi:Fur family ferric uptake transcriptional regulator
MARGQGPAQVDVTAQLRDVGLRVTVPRKAVLTWLAEHPHATADSIRAGVAAELGSVSHQTVYDVLRVGATAGLVRVIEPAGLPALFERRTGDNHHHVVCRGCGRTEDDDCARGSAPCLSPNDDHGFTVDEAEILFWGLCPTCTTNHHEERQ